MMKKLKLFLIIVLALPFTNVNAQTESGKFLFGGASKIGFSSTKTKLSANGESEDYSKTSTFNFSPQVGYFVIDGLAIGAEIPMAIQKEKIDFFGEKVTNSSLAVAVAPFVRYYFGTQNIKPFVHGGLGFGSEILKSETDGNTDEATNKITLYSIGGGIGFFVNERISFDCGIFYSSMTRKLDNFMGSDMKVDETTSGLNLSVGLVVVF